MKTSSLASIVMVLAAASAPAHAQIYKWVDASGKTHYSDTAPAGGKNSTGRSPADPSAGHHHQPLMCGHSPRGSW